MRSKALFSYCLVLLLAFGGLATGAEPEEEARNTRKEFLDVALALCRAEREARTRGEALLDVTLAYAGAGCTQEAEQAGREALIAIAQETWSSGMLIRLIQSTADVGLTQVAREGLKGLGNPESQIRALTGIARAEAKRGDEEQAVATLREVISRIENTEGKQRAGMMIRNMAEACADLKHSEAASELLRWSVETARQIDKSVADDTLESIAPVMHRCGQHGLAQEAALAISSPSARSRALLSLAQLAPSPEGADKVELYLESLSQVAAKLGPQERAQALAQAALLYAKAGLSEKAVGTLAECTRALSSAAADVRTDQARATMVDTWLQLGKDDEALAIPKSMSTETAQVTAYSALVRHLAAKGDYDKALRVAQMPASTFAVSRFLSNVVEECARATQYDRATQILRSIENMQFRGNAQRVAAEQAAKNGDLTEALAFANGAADAAMRDAALTKAILEYMKAKGVEALKDIEELERTASLIRVPSDRVTVLTELTRLCRRANRTQDVARFVQAIRGTPSLFEKGGDKTAVACIMAELGDKETARKLFEQALASARLIGCSGCRLKTLANIRERMIASGMLDMALEDVQQLGRPYDIGHGLLTIAAEHLKAGREDEARPLLRKALGLVRSITELRERVNLLTELGAAYERHGLLLGEEELEALHETASSAEAVELPPKSWAGQTFLLLFYQPGCPTCAEVEELMEDLQQVLPDLHIKSMSILTRDGADMNKSLCLKLGIPSQDHGTVPSVFSNKTALIGRDITWDSLRALAASARDQPAPWQSDPVIQMAAHNAMAETIKGLTPAVVVAAGLTDGINPCAFAVIVFFVTYMAYVGKSKREIALAGGLYTAAVFATYLVIGMALSMAAKQDFLASGPARTVIYVVMAVLLTVASVLSFRDGVLCMRGRAKEVTLKLPDGLKRKIHRIMTQRARKGLTMLSALSLGALVAMIELPCTGQTYVPIILYLSQETVGGLGWLVLYNVCFILPLLVLFLCVLFGLTSQQATALFQRHLPKTKFALGVLFLVLAAVMVVQVL